MLRVVLPPTTTYDDELGRFVDAGNGQVLHLEHSLLAISKWESKWEVPFLEQNFSMLSDEQTNYYLWAMIIEDAPEDIVQSIPIDEIRRINQYIATPQTATTIHEPFKPRTKKRDIWTAERFYHAIFANQMPMEVELWNINRLYILFSIYRIENEKQNPKKRRSGEEINSMYDQRHALNEQRKKMLNSKG